MAPIKFPGSDFAARPRARHLEIAAPVGDVTNPMRCGKTWQRALTFLGEKTFRLQLLFKAVRTQPEARRLPAVRPA